MTSVALITLCLIPLRLQFKFKFHETYYSSFLTETTRNDSSGINKCNINQVVNKSIRKVNDEGKKQKNEWAKKKGII